MNQQSDSVELFGGYKPINIKFLMEPLCEAFMDALTPSFKENNRDVFIRNFNNNILNRQGNSVVGRIESIVKMLFQKKMLSKNLRNGKKFKKCLRLLKHI